VSAAFNPLPALTHSRVLDLNAACRPKRTKTHWHVRIFKCPLKKTQPSCPGNRDLNWTGNGLIYIRTKYSISVASEFARGTATTATLNQTTVTLILPCHLHRGLPNGAFIHGFRTERCTGTNHNLTVNCFASAHGFAKYSKTCLKRNAIVPVFFPRFHRFPFYKGLCFNKTKYKKI
jgi:hypothetical protein